MDTDHSQRKSTAGPRKVRRISRACDFCHNRSIRCRPSEEQDRCQNCLDFDQACTYNRPQKRSKRQDPPKPFVSETYADIFENQPVIDVLVEVYFEIIYPIFPFHHGPSFLERIRKREHHSSKPFFANLMSLCALAAARLRDKASPKERQIRADPVKFARATKESIPKDLTAARGLDFLRTCAMLAIYHIQDGDRDEMHQYLGMYLSLVAMDGLHDESMWPENLSFVEIEERRRLFWSMYTLEVFTSTVWGSVNRLREAQCRVRYPSEVDDEQLGLAQPSLDCWIHGWNYVTELYRVLEHVTLAHSNDETATSYSIVEMFHRASPDHKSVARQLMQMHDELPPQFKTTRGAVDIRDIYGFQAANIVATSDDNFVDGKVDLCNELLDSLQLVPLIFLKALSSPLLYHISAIGSILGSFIRGQQSYEVYARARQTMHRMMELLERLELDHSRSLKSSEPLKTHLMRIEEAMRESQSNPSGSGIIPTAPLNYPNHQAHALERGAPGFDPGFDVELPPDLMDHMQWSFALSQGFNV